MHQVQQSTRNLDLNNRKDDSLDVQNQMYSTILPPNWGHKKNSKSNAPSNKIHSCGLVPSKVNIHLDNFSFEFSKLINSGKLKNHLVNNDKPINPKYIIISPKSV